MGGVYIDGGLQGKASVCCFALRLIALRMPQLSEKRQCYQSVILLIRIPCGRVGKYVDDFGGMRGYAYCAYLIVGRKQ